MEYSRTLPANGAGGGTFRPLPRQTLEWLIFIQFNSVSESFDATQLMTRNGFTRIDSNQLTTQNGFQIKITAKKLP